MFSKKIPMYGLMIALAMILSYVESIIPMHFAVPGMKLGLANIVVIIALYKLGTKDAFILSIFRIVLVGLTFGNLYSMVYSLAGGLLSCLVMILSKRMKSFSMVGVSVLGGISHNIGQILVAMFVVNSTNLIYYLPVLLISGIVTGILIGLLGAELVKRIKI